MRWCRVGLRPGWRLLESSQSPGHHSSVRPCDPDRLTDRQTDRLTDLQTDRLSDIRYEGASHCERGCSLSSPEWFSNDFPNIHSEKLLEVKHSAESCLLSNHSIYILITECVWQLSNNNNPASIAPSQQRNNHKFPNKSIYCYISRKKENLIKAFYMKCQKERSFLLSRELMIWL